MKQTEGQKKIKQFLGRLNNLPEIAVSSFFASLKREEKEIEDDNRTQLFSGEYVDGSRIKPKYTNLTVAIKTKKGQPTDRVTLKDTGAFYSGIKATVKSNELIIDSTDSKTSDLFTKYGSGQLLGLNEVNHNDIVEKSIPLANKEIVLKLFS